MRRTLNVEKYSPEVQTMLDVCRRRVVGQEEAINAIVNVVEAYQAGFTDPSRPAGNALFLGPTGTGKTLTVEAVCEALFGDSRACLKIDCAEFQHSHEIAKLIGSPPGYLGHRETHPMLTQEALNQWHTEKMKLSVVLFDEIEKASDALWNLLLGILDKATLTLGDNRRVNFSQTVIVMTSNLGSAQMSNLVDGGIGFVTQSIQDAILDSKLSDVAKEAAKKKFTPEFFNRINEVVVFRTLTEEQIRKILDIELDRLAARLFMNSRVKFFLAVQSKARETLLKEGYDRKYGARHLRRAIEARVLIPLSKLVASGQVLDQDTVIVNEVGKPSFEFVAQGD
jgi:ATP-dependent Clp protease ATP-binding subunit ClpB